ncbi:MAG: hypothetical protein ABJF11_19760 [Reichenbachiella sp.]|uniref:hypothetical protein n=1 Tax=Reichenbachiella sp. TaxID=2184521 RepID=UPI0032643A59
MKKTFLIIAASILCNSSFAQTDKTFENRVALLFGTNQLMVDGFNIEGNIFFKRLAFDYSHGVSLNLDNNLLSGAAKDQGLAVHLPYTTGFGVGYRINEWLNLRAEPKWHKFELYYDGETQNSTNQIASYRTFTLGLGAYVTWLPFKNKENLLRGITIAPSLRYWPKVSDTIDGSLDYDSQITGQTETHDALEVGLANTPWIVNVSIGYSLTF